MRPREGALRNNPLYGVSNPMVCAGSAGNRLRRTTVSTIVLAALGGVAATATAAVATGDASALAHAAHTVPPGLHVALSHVPSTSHAYNVLEQHLSLCTGSGAAGTAATGGAAAVKYGLRFGLGK